MPTLFIIIGILLVIVFAIGMKKENPEKCRFLETWWEYPVPSNEFIKMKYSFTNYPIEPDMSDGNMGLAYECYDLYNKNDVIRVSKINEDWDQRNYGTPFLPNDVINTAVNNHARFIQEGKC